MPSFLSTLLALAAGYLCGSIPFGLILTRLAGLGDIRSIGSGNIGATNVLRTGNKALAAGTLALDVLKGALPVAVAAAIAGGSSGSDTFGLPHAAGLGAFLGHIFPVWLGFKGGKGVATYIGVVAGLYWPLALVFCGVWLGIALLFRLSSLSALIASVMVPVAAFALARPATGLLLSVLSTLLILKHHANIRRLLAGSEPRIGAKN
ncbi:MAG: glycerol-3-phosphate 1-O-acyltransferase PlsY [Hyphomicrobiaceae bacterium]|nr:glycerol-3-phosphate 1-O-acyltransferase PlsY [Hyphomicrobiaceae bacterium]